MFRLKYFNRRLTLKQLNLFLLFASGFFVADAHAAAIGLPDITAKIGFGTKISQVSVNDPQGHTTKVTTPQSASVYVSDWFTKGTRYLAEAYISSYAFNAEGQERVGELVKQNGLRFSVQSNTYVNKFFSPWFGVGLDLSYASFTKRHVVDNEGYLSERYDDMSKPALGMLFNVMEKWSFNSSIDLAAKLEYVAPITQSVSGVSASVIVLFRPLP